MNQIPTLNKSLTISIFNKDANKQTNADTKYLIQLGCNNYVVSTATKNLIEILLIEPKELITLSELYHAHFQEHLNSNEILQLIEQYIPKSLLEGAPAVPAKTPFTISRIVLSPSMVEFLSSKLTWLFKPLVALFLVSIFSTIHGYALINEFNLSTNSWNDTNVYLFLLVMLFSFFVHEFGHATACRNFDCNHGGIGVGLYLIFPVFFADVTSAWRLSKYQRAVIDLGGLYFQAILLIFIDLIALHLNSALCAKLSTVITFTMLYTLNPFLKFDGYWLLSDLSGETNLHRKMRTTIRSIVSQAFKLSSLSNILLKNSKLILAYSALSIAFIIYCINFLFNEFKYIYSELPLKLELWLNNYTLATDNTFSKFTLAIDLIGIFIWPLLLCTFLLFAIKKLMSLIIFEPKEPT